MTVRVYPLKDSGKVELVMDDGAFGRQVAELWHPELEALGHDIADYFGWSIFVPDFEDRDSRAGEDT